MLARATIITIDPTVDIQATIDALGSAGGVVRLGPGTYTLTTTLTIPDGVSLVGSGKSPTTGLPTLLVFTSLTGTTPAILINNGSDIRLADFYLSGRAAGSGNEIDITGNSRRITLERLIVNSSTSGACISMGGAGWVIASQVTGVTTAGAAVGFSTSTASTSINFLNCYANAHSAQGFNIQGTYISLNACASDGNLHGYVIQGAVGVTLNGCGGEGCVKGAVFISNATGVVLNGFRSHANNTGASSYWPSFLLLTGTTGYHTVCSCTDTSPNAATTYSVRPDGLTGDMAESTLSNCNLAKPIESTVFFDPKVSYEDDYVMYDDTIVTY